MGVCTTREDSQKLDEASVSIPKPIIFQSNRFMFLHYTKRGGSYSSFEDVKKNMNEFKLEEFTSIFYKNSAGVNDLLLFLIGSYGTGTYGPKGAMIIELVGSTLMIQVGSAKNMQMLFNEYDRGNTKSFLTYSEPKVTFLKLIESLFLEVSFNSENVRSADKVDDFIRCLVED